MIKALNLNLATSNNSNSQTQKSSAAPSLYTSETAGSIASSAPCSTGSSCSFSAMA